MKVMAPASNRFFGLIRHNDVAGVRLPRLIHFSCGLTVITNAAAQDVLGVSDARFRGLLVFVAPRVAEGVLNRSWIAAGQR